MASSARGARRGTPHLSTGRNGRVRLCADRNIGPGRWGRYSGKHPARCDNRCRFYRCRRDHEGRGGRDGPRYRCQRLGGGHYWRCSWLRLLRYRAHSSRCQYRRSSNPARGLRPVQLRRRRFLKLVSVRHHDGDRPRWRSRSTHQGGLDVGRRDAAVVSVGRGCSAVRGGGHPHHAGISGPQMGLRAADRVYRRGRCVSLRARLPRAAARAARAIRRGALAATLGSTMHCVAGDGVGILAGAVLSSVFGLAGLAEVARRIHSGLRLRLDDFPGAVHARHGRRIIPQVRWRARSCRSCCR